jgi:ribonuclease P protein component
VEEESLKEGETRGGNASPYSLTPLFAPLCAPHHGPFTECVPGTAPLEEVLSLTGGISLVRLKEKQVRQELFSKGKKKVSKIMTLFFMENNVGIARYAIYSSRRLGGAVARNRIKRTFREILNGSKSRLQGYDFIIIPREGVKGVSSKDMGPLVEQEFLNVGIMGKSGS